MNCSTNMLSTWDQTPDLDVVYTGCDVSYNGAVIFSKGMSMRQVLEIMMNVVVDNITPPLPIYEEDERVNLDSTSGYINNLYPDVANGSIVYNEDENIQFTKLPTGWKKEFLEIA